MEWKDFTVEHNQSSQLEVSRTRQTPQLLDQAVHWPPYTHGKGILTNNAGSITDSRMVSRVNHQHTP